MNLRRPYVFVLILVNLSASGGVSDSHAQGATALSRVTPHPGRYSQPAISGDTVIWFDARRSKGQPRVPGTDIDGRNLRTGREFRITSLPTADTTGSLLVSQQTVLWEDCRYCRPVNGLPGYTGDRIFLYNLTHGREHSLPIHAYGQIGPWLLAGLAVWGKRAAHGRVTFYAADSIHGQPRPLATDRAFRRLLSVRAHQVAWSDGYDLRIGNLLTGGIRLLALHAPGDGALTDPVISGHRAIWTRWPQEKPVAIDGVDFNSWKRFHVVTLPANHYNPQFGPDKTISGDAVIWVETQHPISTRSPHWLLRGRDLSSGRSLRFAVDQRDRTEPTISGGRLVSVETNAHGSLARSLVVIQHLGAARNSTDPIRPMQFRSGG